MEMERGNRTQIEVGVELVTTNTKMGGEHGHERGHALRITCALVWFSCWYEWSQNVTGT